VLLAIARLTTAARTKRFHMAGTMIVTAAHS
jgi:hypothetical protein